jgi:superfamily II DNA or RNA helicase
MLQLRDYQEKFVQDIRQAFADGNRAVLGVLPTGGGKTVVFSYIASQMAMQTKRAHILVHRIELLKQTYKAMYSTGVRTGLVNPAYHADTNADVQVASVQTLVKRTGIYRAPDLIVVDEAHHAIAGTWKKILDAYPNSYVLGVTATPCRGDGVGLGREVGGLFDTMVEGPQTPDLIERGFLVKPRTFRPPTNLDLSGIRTLKSGDYDTIQLGERVDKPAITGDAVEHYTKLCAGKPAVVFCVTVAHAHHVAEQFRQAGYRAYAVDGNLDDYTRASILTGLGNGNVQVVTSCDIISEGTDIPAIECAILLRPTQSLGLYLQQVGRALRTADGKTSAIVLDHVGNSITHGFAEDKREWSLTGEVKRKKEKSENAVPAPMQCTKCYAVYKRELSRCPECGNEEEKPKPKQLEYRPGELIEASRDPEAEAQAEMVRDIKKMKALQKVAQMKGYKEGWVTRTFNAQKEKEKSRKVTEPEYVLQADTDSSKNISGNTEKPYQLPNHLYDYI